MQGPWWHQWQLNGHYKSLVGINGNSLNNLPFCHWWQHSCNNSWPVKFMLPLSLSLSPPLASMAKGTHMLVLLHMSSLPSAPPYQHIACSPCHHAPLVLSPSAFHVLSTCFFSFHLLLASKRKEFLLVLWFWHSWCVGFMLVIYIHLN